MWAEMTCQLRMVNVCAWSMQTSNKTMIIMCTNRVKKPIPLGSYGKYSTKNDAKSKEIQKNFLFQVNKAFPKQQDIMVLKTPAKSELFPL